MCNIFLENILRMLDLLGSPRNICSGFCIYWDHLEKYVHDFDLRLVAHHMMLMQMKMQAGTRAGIHQDCKEIVTSDPTAEGHKCQQQDVGEAPH